MRVIRMLKSLAADERGAAVIEYVLVAGLVIVAAIAIITTVGTKVVARWTSVGDGL